ncbi:ADP-ribosylglycohydrolase family protein [Nesterenkonia sp.]|uniref:ADP-ribosylglycohydrolase family protein n=1 Tax=Nesterenkonia sp. TaxID=704201 RepID=UPI00262162D5|nr:ADP-ribosylglycohydrolase family protein [Nesterenkonia sp.]
MSDDQRLISQCAPLLTQDFPAPVGGVIELHAEQLHRLCLADGLLEVLEWAQQGTGADPQACMWLAGLRWYRLLTGGFPDPAPQPPPRQLDSAVSRLMAEGRLRCQDSTGETALAGLASGELHYPGDPAKPQAPEDGALLRLVPIALVPYIDSAMRSRWVEQALAMTHGDPELTRRGQEFVDELNRRAGQEPAAAEPDAGRSPDHPLYEVVDALAARWEAVTRPR